jgi:flagellar hook-associated protein 2
VAASKEIQVATISSPGVGSGMDVKTIVTQLMATEQGAMNKLVQSEAKDQAKISAFGTLKSALSSFQTAASTLNMSSTFTAVTPAVADNSYYTASLNGVAVAGSYNIEVKALADAQKLVSQAYTATSTVVGDGTLKLSIGKYDTTTTPPGFNQKAGTSTVSINIDSTNHTLAGIRDAINAANAGVSASIINDGTGARLAVTSSDSGTANAVRVDVTESGDAGLAKLAYNGAAGTGLEQKVSPADAHLIVDGVDVYKPSNTVTDAVQGVTLNLLKTTTSADKLSLTRDTSKISKAMDDFVSTFNSVHKQLVSLTAYDASTQTGALLTGDATATAIDSKLRSMIAGTVANGVAGLSSLTDIGIGFEKDGTLSVNADRRDKILSDPTKDVKKLFVKSSDKMVGLASVINDGVSKMILGSDATINQRVDSLKSDVLSIGKRKTVETTRLLQVEARYTKQFSGLDTLIASMNTTQQFLTQQLAALSANAA